MKKLLELAVLYFLGVISSGAMADPLPPTYTTTWNSTNYDFTYVTGTYNDLQSTYFNTTKMPWYGGDAGSAATQVGANLGYPNTLQAFSAGPIFVYSYDNGSGYGLGAAYYSGFGPSLAIFDAPSTYSFAVATVHSGVGGGVAPEMNASFIPQVGLLLGYLFFLLGRKKEVVEPMLAA